MELKVGFGYDIHRLRRGRKLYLGGVEIPFSRGLAGHSDGDCLIHALIDALLGAMGEGDIGQLFPDSDEKYKGIRSTELLEAVMRLLIKNKINVLHVDSVIVAEAPKVAPFIPLMKEALGRLLNLPGRSIGIKAKTNEGLGLIGQGEAIACWATALVMGGARRKQQG